MNEYYYFEFKYYGLNTPSMKHMCPVTPHIKLVKDHR